MPTFDQLIDEAAELLTGTAMIDGPESLGIQKVLEAWVILDHVYNVVDARKKALREFLLERAEKYGAETEKGGQKLLVEGTAVLREKRVASLPDESALRGLLEAHGIPFDQAFSKVTQVVMDASKIGNLVSLGKLKEQDVEDLKKVTWALRVKPSEGLSSALDFALGVSQPEVDSQPTVEGRKTKTPRARKPKATGARKGK